ncbi:MAG TPA: formimidoylglutamate deiminase [Acetobacteraceae bacterium]|jgi:formiminoglutamate deiminase|nr:formimidoylglutamate deiminase [Acetobacteraceae bacterium]
MEPDAILFFDRALLPDGWASDVRIAVTADGDIAAIETGAAAAGASFHAEVAVPGLPNLHSHAFQRGMAGLSERGGPGDDHFWTWREVMYLFLGELTPDDVEAIAELAYAEMLESGFTGVAEFHYLHHDRDGGAYANPAELAERIVAAASATGIGLTLLPSLYMQGGFADAPPSHGQRRFVTDLDTFARLVEASAAAIVTVPDARLGVAPHSLRAVGGAAIAAVARLVPDGPVHIHAAELTDEVEACLAVTGSRPVEYLLDRVGLDARWCVIHATHMTDDETARLARSGAVAGLCPLTEANLGDGIFPATEYMTARGAFGLGTDSNICIDAPRELAALEYAQRLRHRARNRLAPAQGSTGRALFAAAARGGAQALGREIGALASGARADIVVLDPDHEALAGRSDDTLLDSWIFAARTNPVTDVFVGGVHVVRHGRHKDREPIAARWRTVARRLADRA